VGFRVPERLPPVAPHAAVPVPLGALRHGFAFFHEGSGGRRRRVLLKRGDFQARQQRGQRRRQVLLFGSACRFFDRVGRANRTANSSG